MHIERLRFGERLKDELKGIPNTELAELCGVTPGAVSNWFRTGRISKGNQLTLAKRYRLSFEALIEGVDPEEPLQTEHLQGVVQRLPSHAAVASLPSALVFIAERLKTIDDTRREAVVGLFPTYFRAEPEQQAAIVRAIEALLDRRVNEAPRAPDRRTVPYSYAANESRPGDFSDEPQKGSKG